MVSLKAAQERSTYQAEQLDSHYQTLFRRMTPAKRESGDGSVIVANYGKGNFVYSVWSL